MGPSHHRTSSARAGELIPIETMTCLQRSRFLFLFALILLFVGAAQAPNPVSWSIKTNASGSLKPGDKFTAQVIAQIQSGWHIYSISALHGVDRSPEALNT